MSVLLVVVSAAMGGGGGDSCASAVAGCRLLLSVFDLCAGRSLCYARMYMVVRGTKHPNGPFFDQCWVVPPVNYPTGSVVMARMRQGVIRLGSDPGSTSVSPNIYGPSLLALFVLCWSPRLRGVYEAYETIVRRVYASSFLTDGLAFFVRCMYHG